jgi:hypothetical protein
MYVSGLSRSDVRDIVKRLSEDHYEGNAFARE